MPNPILEQEAPRMSTSDLRFLLKINKPKVEELKRKLSLAYCTVSIIESELEKRK